MITNILHNALIAITNNSDKVDWITPLTFTAQEPNSTVALCTMGKDDPEGIQYRTNINDEWLTCITYNPIVLTNVGDYVQFQNTNNQLTSKVIEYIFSNDRKDRCFR